MQLYDAKELLKNNLCRYTSYFLIVPNGKTECYTRKLNDLPTDYCYFLKKKQIIKWCQGTPRNAPVQILHFIQDSNVGTISPWQSHNIHTPKTVPT